MASIIQTQTALVANPAVWTPLDLITRAELTTSCCGNGTGVPPESPILVRITLHMTSAITQGCQNAPSPWALYATLYVVTSIPGASVNLPEYDTILWPNDPMTILLSDSGGSFTLNYVGAPLQAPTTFTWPNYAGLNIPVSVVWNTGFPDAHVDLTITDPAYTVLPGYPPGTTFSGPTATYPVLGASPLMAVTGFSFTAHGLTPPSMGSGTWDEPSILLHQILSLQNIVCAVPLVQSGNRKLFQPGYRKLPKTWY